MRTVTRPLWRLEDLFALCFQPEEIRRLLCRWHPLLAAELPPVHESAAQFAHEVVMLLDRHGVIDAALFTNLLRTRPLRRAQVMSAACALGVDSAAIESLVADGEVTRPFRSPMISPPQLVDELEVLVLERERAVPEDPRRAALCEDIERLAAQIRARRPVRIGDRVAGTILECLVGHGAYGAVWRSRDAETGAPRATKIFDLNRLTDGVMLWRFRRGIQALETIHRGGVVASIARVYTVAEDRLAFAMEYLPKGALDRIERRSWTLDERVSVFSDICQAVSLAHQAGIIHRDLKPTNIMFDPRMRPVLIDFDIAGLPSEQRVTNGGLGTPVFAAPEQIECAGQVDERADVYSLGRLLHYMLIERVPTCQEQDDLLEHLSHVPPSLALTIRKATQRRPCDRFRSVAQLRRDVEAYKTGLSAIQAQVRRSLHWVRRHAVLVTLTTAGTTYSLGYAKQQAALAVTEAQHRSAMEEWAAKVKNMSEDLDSLQSSLAEARQHQVVLSAKLEEARTRLEALEEEGRAPGGPQDPERFATEHSALTFKITLMKKQLAETEAQLDALHQQMGDRVGKIERTLREQPGLPEGSAGRSSPTPPPASESAPDQSDDVQPGELPRASQALQRSQVPRTRPARPAKRAPVPKSIVDVMERNGEVRRRIDRLRPKVGRCRDRGSPPGARVGFMLSVDYTGAVFKSGNTWGEMSPGTLGCIKRLIEKQRFSPMKPGSRNTGHQFEFRLR